MIQNPFFSISTKNSILISISSLQYLNIKNSKLTSSQYSISDHSIYCNLCDVVKRASGSSNILSVLEPPGLSTADQKRPDGLTLVPWERGQSLLWDATVVDALAPSRLSSGTASQFSAASEAENRKTSESLT